MKNDNNSIFAMTCVIVFITFIFEFVFCITFDFFVLFLIPIAYCFLLPIATIIKPQNYKNTYWILFAIFLIFFFAIGVSAKMPIIMLIMFIGAFCLKPNADAIRQNFEKSDLNNLQRFCPYCKKPLANDSLYCTYCGKAYSNETAGINEISQNKTLSYDNFDSMYKLDENLLLEEFIKRELIKAEIEDNDKIIPKAVLKRKNILRIIFAVLVFIYVSLIFFHFPFLTYLIGAIIIIIFHSWTNNFSLVDYLKKEVLARPGEKVSNIVMNTKMSLTPNNTKVLSILSLTAAIILPLIIFFKPHIMYEKIDEGYSVRFYTFGLSNFKTATIPAYYHKLEVVSLRGNTFSNMPFLEKVELPNTITEIRGQAFKNDINLKTVNIPSKLSYLGGGAFYNCQSIEEIILPDTLEYLGGEAFYNATSLKKIKLSENLDEIKGNTFENCKSLETIKIPNKVTRIGGHAFYGNSSLSNVTFTENSSLKEIGSSAFRKCPNLYKIIIPRNAYVNPKAFKESPTQKYFFDSLLNKENFNRNAYKHMVYQYFNKNKVKTINEFFTDSPTYDHKLILDSINCDNTNNCVYNFIYDNLIHEEKFTLSRKNTYKILSENIVVEIPNSAYYYNTGISINIYYN